MVPVIHIHASNGNLIGTDSDGVNDDLERNIISGNRGGVEIAGGNDNVVAGNYIGTDRTGTTTIGNGLFANGSGIIIDYSGTGNTIGGTTRFRRRNVIAGSAYGVRLFPSRATSSRGNVVEGNYIGTDATGQVALGNPIGVDILGATSNLIGGTSPAEGNVISGNAQVGVWIHWAATGNRVLGNWIGTDPTGSTVTGSGQSDRGRD